MLDDNDIKKLIEAQKEIFVTKDDFKSLKGNFATKQDIENLIDVIATKDELSGVEKRLSEKLDVIDKKLDKVDAIEKEVEYIKNIFNIPAMKKS